MATDEAQQIFKPLPASKGKTGSEARQFREQMDLIDMKNSPSRFRGKGPQFKYAILIIDVMSRFEWSAPLINEEATAAEPVLRRLTNSTDKRRAFISSDKGSEFTGQVDEMLEEKTIIHRSKSSTHDMTTSSVVGRAI